MIESSQDTGASSRILIVDDHAMVAEALAMLLGSSPLFEVAGVATTGEEALVLATDSNPDIALVDVHLPGRSGFDVADQIRRRLDDVVFVFLSGTVSDLDLHRALSLGCGGFLFKGLPLKSLRDSIQQVARGEQVFSEPLHDRLERAPETGALRCRRQTVLMNLTARQLDVLRYLASGLSVKETAALMHLSEKAVDSQKYRIMKRLDVHDRVELTRLAIREGLLEP